jgi:hypothetical protein
VADVADDAHEPIDGGLFELVGDAHDLVRYVPAADAEAAPPTAGETVLVEVDADAGVATITLNRPDALNSLTVPMKQALLAAFRRLERDKAVRAVILTGAGRAFCAGQDLRERLEPDAAPLGVEVRERYNPIVRAMRNLPKPIVGAINGVAAGAAPRWQWPATSGSRPTRRASPWRSGAWGWCRTAARRGSCRASWARRAPRSSRCSTIR